MFDRIRTAPLLALGALTVFLVGCGGSNLFERLQNPFGGICSLIILILDVIAIVEVINSSKSTGEKVLWCLLIFFLPVLGLILYHFIGKK